jgi:hypothetical protein
VYCHVSHPLTILQTAAAATTADTAATDDDDDDNDDDEGESVGNSEGEDDEDNEDLLSDMGPKKVPAPAAAAAAAPKKGAPAKSGKNVDALADLLQGATITKGAVKKPAFTSYSTKVQDPFLIRTNFVDGDQWVEFDLSIAAASLCGDEINAVLVSEGWGISLQRGLYASFFTNRRLRKDLGVKYNKDSDKVTAHRKVCDEFKKKETSVRSGVVYGECQYIQLPCECTGLVERIYKGVVPTPITVPYPVTTNEDGMRVTVEEVHIQFMLHITFRVKTVSQLEKEKKKVVEVTHTNYDIFADYDSEGSL